MALDQVESSLPDGASAAYEHALLENEEGLTALFRAGRSLMIKLEGTVLNVFTQQGGKDKKTGDQFADRDKVQILGAMDLPNGDVKNELLRYQ